MRFPLSALFLAISFLSSPAGILQGQYAKLEEISLFGTRLNSPIVTEVQRSEDKIIFYVLSKSYFTYDFTLEFSEFKNLSPRIFDYHTKIFLGRNRLFNLEITDKSQPISYRYSYKYSMQIPDKLDTNFPYLVPIGEDKIVSLKESKSDNGILYYLNQFKLSQCDTVFASRKGIITALPDNKEEVERVFKTLSLEILHNDGTIGIYLGLDPGVNLHKLGEIVYPGEPIGIVAEGQILAFHVTAAKDNVKIETLPILYSDQNGNPISSQSINNTKVFYPAKIIQKELTSKESRKYKKNSKLKE